MNQLCECSNLEWDESIYHLEHHPNCGQSQEPNILYVVTPDIITRKFVRIGDLPKEAQEAIRKAFFNSPKSPSASPELVQEIYSESPRPIGGTFTVWTYNGEITFPYDMTAEEIQAALEAPPPMKSWF